MELPTDLQRTDNCVGTASDVACSLANTGILTLSPFGLLYNNAI